MERTIKETRGELKTERQIAFANALKALDEDKEMQQMYEMALRDIAETMFDMEFDENNEPIVSPNDTK